MFQVSASSDQSVINCNIELPFIRGHAKSEDGVVACLNICTFSQNIYCMQFFVTTCAIPFRH